MQRTTAKRPTAAPAGQKQPGAAEAQATQAEAAATAEGQTDRRERDSDQPNTPPPARQTSHQTRPDSGTRHATLNTEAPPKQAKRWAGEPPQGGTPATFSPTPQTARRQGRRRGGPDFLARQHRRLPWPCRRVGWGVSPPRGRAFPSFPLAGGPLKLSFRKAQLRFRSRSFRGANSGPSCPHFDKSGGEGGTHRLSVFARLAGWGRGVLFRGADASRWGLCVGSGGQCVAAFVAKHWPTGPKHRPQPAPAAAAWSRPTGRRNTA